MSVSLLMEVARLGAQDELLDLASQGAVQRPEDDGLRRLKPGELGPAEGDDILVGRCGVVLQQHEGTGGSPHFSSGRAMTAASSISGWR
jgi:hypothetical protein